MPKLTPALPLLLVALGAPAEARITDRTCTRLAEAIEESRAALAQLAVPLDRRATDMLLQLTDESDPEFVAAVRVREASDAVYDAATERLYALEDVMNEVCAGVE